MTGQDLKRKLADAARAAGYRVDDRRRSKGDELGLPDLAILRPGVGFWDIECKGRTEHLSAEQLAYAEDALATAAVVTGYRYRICRPANCADVAHELGLQALAEDLAPTQIAEQEAARRKVWAAPPPPTHVPTRGEDLAALRREATRLGIDEALITQAQSAGPSVLRALVVDEKRLRSQAPREEETR